MSTGRLNVVNGSAFRGQLEQSLASKGLSGSGCPSGGDAVRPWAWTSPRNIGQPNFPALSPSLSDHWPQSCSLMLSLCSSSLLLGGPDP